MYLSVFSDEELKQYAKRVSKWLSTVERDKIASEFDSRGLNALALGFRPRPVTPIEEARIEEAREKARKVVEREWRKQGCAKDSLGNWNVPYGLIWRSMPRGEDR